MLLETVCFLPLRARFTMFKCFAALLLLETECFLPLRERFTMFEYFAAVLLGGTFSASISSELELCACAAWVSTCTAGSTPVTIAKRLRRWDLAPDGSAESSPRYRVIRGVSNDVHLYQRCF